MWSSTDESSVVISSASTTMINHLRDCNRQPKNIRAQAQDKKSSGPSGSKKRGNQDDGYDDTEGDSPVVNRYHSYSTNFGNPMPPPQFTTPFASTSSSSHQGPYPQNYGSQASGYSSHGDPSGSREPGPDIPSIRTSLVDRRPSFSSSARYDPYPTPFHHPPSDHGGSSFTGGYHSSYHNSPDLSHGLPGLSRSPSIISSVGPMDSVSSVGTGSVQAQGVPSTSKSRGKKRARGSTTSESIQPWSDDRKKRWERLLIHLTASANFPLMWVQNPVWHTILDEFLPQAPRISRKVLTRRLLREAAADLRAKAKAAVKGKQVTMQADGWTGINHHHLIAFMVTCDKKVCFAFTSI